MTVVLAGSAGLAQQADPLKSVECAKALGVLQAQEDLALASPPAGGTSEWRDRRAVQDRQGALRRQAAVACLGGHPGLHPPSQRFAQPPITVAPIAVIPPVQRPAVPASPVVPLPQRIGPAPTVVSCDPLGCWTSEGSRLPRVGPSLLGPNGLCSVQGPLLSCP